MDVGKIQSINKGGTYYIGNRYGYCAC